LFLAYIHTDLCLVVCYNYSKYIKKTNHNTRHEKSAQKCTLAIGKENMNTAGPPHLQVCASQFCLLQKNYSDNLCASQCRLHAYSQSCLHSNTQQTTSAHVSCSASTQISWIYVFEKYFFFLTIYKTNSCHHVLIMSGKGWQMWAGIVQSA
jgi:hypothetical protein